MSRSNMQTQRANFIALREFAILYDFKFDPIKAYLDKTQEMIHLQEIELTEKFNKWNQERGKNPEMPDAFDFYESEIINSSEFASILNQSIYLTIYSTFENEFLKLCEWCQYTEHLNIGPKDIKDQNYIGQCRKFITNVLNVNLDGLNQEWNEIRKYQTIRNSIAHNGGILKDAKTDILNFVKHADGILIDPKSSKIEINSIEFLKTLIDKLADLLIRVIEEIIRQKENVGTNT